MIGRIAVAVLSVAFAAVLDARAAQDEPVPDTPIRPGTATSICLMAEAAAKANATILMSNHSEFDNAVTKIKLLAARKAGEPHPFELGREAVQRYFKVMDECAQVARLKLL